MRVLIFPRSLWRISFFLLCCLLMVSFGVLPSNAQTFTPDPDCCSTIVPTPGAIQTNTPEFYTVTPQPDKDRTGCPEEDFDQDNLDPSWVGVCSRCLEDRATPVATIQQFILVTKPPIGTPGSVAAVPTLPPMYHTPTPGGVVLPTGTPAPTATGEADDWHSVFYDFTLDHYNMQVYPHACTGNDQGAWNPGFGWQPVYGGCGGGVWAYQIKWTMDELLPPLARNFTLHGVFGSTDYFTLSGDPQTAPYITPDFDSTIQRVRRWNDERDYRGWAITDVGTGVVLEGLSFEYFGQEGEFDEDDEPTPTPAPTVPAMLFLCDDPQYTDISVPIVDIDFDDSDLGENCYTIVPELNVTVTDPDIVYVGLQLCVQWKAVPALSLLGLTFTVDLILIIPAAYVVKRLLNI